MKRFLENLEEVPSIVRLAALPPSYFYNELSKVVEVIVMTQWAILTYSSCTSGMLGFDNLRQSCHFQAECKSFPFFVYILHAFEVWTSCDFRGTYHHSWTPARQFMVFPPPPPTHTEVHVTCLANECARGSARVSAGYLGSPRLLVKASPGN